MRLATAAAFTVILRCLAVLSGTTLILTIAVAPAVAQQGDLNAILKRFNLVARVLHNLAGAYRAEGKYADAEALYKRALAIEEKARGANHRDVGVILHDLALVYKDKGKYTEADSLYSRALPILEDKLGKEHPEVANAFAGLANVERAQGSYTEAEAHYKVR